jgi:hypothetical protein
MCYLASFKEFANLAVGLSDGNEGNNHPQVLGRGGSDLSMLAGSKYFCRGPSRGKDRLHFNKHQRLSH